MREKGAQIWWLSSPAWPGPDPEVIRRSRPGPLILINYSKNRQIISHMNKSQNEIWSHWQLQCKNANDCESSWCLMHAGILFYPQSVLNEMCEDTETIWNSIYLHCVEVQNHLQRAAGYRERLAGKYVCLWCVWTDSWWHFSNEVKCCWLKTKCKIRRPSSIIRCSAVRVSPSSFQTPAFSWFERTVNQRGPQASARRRLHLTAVERFHPRDRELARICHTQEFTLNLQVIRCGILRALWLAEYIFLCWYKNRDDPEVLQLWLKA